MPAVPTRSGRSIRRPSASRPSTRVITIVASGGGENAYCDSGPNGHTSSLIRSEPFSSRPMPSTATAIRQARPARLIGARCSTGRLQHNRRHHECRCGRQVRSGSSSRNAVVPFGTIWVISSLADGPVVAVLTLRT